MDSLGIDNSNIQILNVAGGVYYLDVVTINSPEIHLHFLFESNERIILWYV